MNRKRLFRISGAVLVVAALFGLAMNLVDYSPKGGDSLFRKIPVPKKLEEVLGEAKELIPGQKKAPEKESAPEPQALSLAEVKEGAKEKVVEESKEVVREKVVEILKELIDKLGKEEETKGKVCDQICEEVCQEVCE